VWSRIPSIVFASFFSTRQNVRLNYMAMIVDSISWAIYEIECVGTWRRLWIEYRFHCRKMVWCSDWGERDIYVLQQNDVPQGENHIQHANTSWVLIRQLARCGKERKYESGRNSGWGRWIALEMEKTRLTNDQSLDTMQNRWSWNNLQLY
jgi:hypothetical protein